MKNLSRFRVFNYRNVRVWKTIIHKFVELSTVVFQMDASTERGVHVTWKLLTVVIQSLKFAFFQCTKDYKSASFTFKDL